MVCMVKGIPLLGLHLSRIARWVKGFRYLIESFLLGRLPPVLCPSTVQRQPEEMSEYFNLRWVNSKIWLIDSPTHNAEISLFQWHLDCPFWASNPPDQFFDLRPRDVINYPKRYPERFQQILTVDTSFPIETMYFESRLVILDGIHRLANLIVNDIPEIKYRIFPREHFALIEQTK